MGHLEAAAGITSFIKGVLSIHHGEIAPHLHAQTLSPLIPWDELPLQVPTTLQKWPENRRKIVGVSAFGFSGTNVHCILGEAPPALVRESDRLERPLHVITVSARTPIALRALATQYANRLSDGSGTLPDVAYTANAGRAHGFCRRAVVAASREECELAMHAVSEEREHSGVFKGELTGTDTPRIAFLFSGQGAQYSGMGLRLFETQPTFRRALEQCASILNGQLDRPLLDILFKPENASLLSQTGYTQPALFSLEYALSELWRSWGVRPTAVLGHSLGEYVAACVAGVFGLEDALRFVAARARLMQSLPEGGAMASILATEEQVLEFIAKQKDRLSIAAVNAPMSVVISGAASDVDAVCQEFAAASIKSKRLAVSHAFHSPLMDPILDEFERAAKLGSYSPPSIPLISNLTGEAFVAGQVPDADYWRRHARHTVQYAASVEGLYKKGCRIFLEIGPHPVLTALGRLTIADESCAWLPSLREGKGTDDWRTMLESLASLYASGLGIDWRGFDCDYNRRVVSLPTYPFERRRYWVERRPLKSTLTEMEGAHHPLLGLKLESPALREVVFQSRISAVSPSFIEEHRIFNTTVLPATAYIELALAAGSRSIAKDDKLCRVCDLLIHEAMIFREDEVRTVQVVIAPASESTRALRIYSKTDTEDGASSWKLHASAHVIQASSPAKPEMELDEIRRRCTRPAPAGSLYSSFAKLGINLGSRFQGNVGLWCGTGEALAQIEVPPSTAKEAKHYCFHPAWLDNCLQTLAGALGIHEDGQDPSVFLPIAFESIEVSEPPSGRLWAHATLTSSAGAETDAITGNITVYNDDERVVAKLSGVALKRADAKVLWEIAGRFSDEAERSLYEVAWEAAPIALCDAEAAPADLHASPKCGDRWLIFADRGGLGDRLAKRLQLSGGATTIVRMGESFSSDEDGTFTVNPAAPQDFVAVMEASSKTHSTGWHSVVYLWGLDCTPSSRVTADSLEKDVSFACGGALHLLQALPGHSAAARVWLVTRSACSVDEHGGPIESAQATLWGLGRSAALEHPEWRCTNIDLSSEVGADDIAILFTELTSDSEEDRIAWRPDGRLVARLVPWHRAES